MTSRAKHPTQAPGHAKHPHAFRELQASELYCPTCLASRPVRERLLLVLPDGELHEYRCAACATSLGTRTVRAVRSRLSKSQCNATGRSRARCGVLTLPATADSPPLANRVSSSRRWG